MFEKIGNLNSAKSYRILKSKKRSNINIIDCIIILICLIWGIMIFYPFYNSVIVSLVPQHVYIKTPFLLYPKEINLAAYRFVFNNRNIWWGVKTSVIILTVGVVYNMLLTVTLAYALTRPFPGRKCVVRAIIFTLYFGGGLIPFYLLVRQLGLVDTYLAMILPTGVSFMYVTVMRRYFEGIPFELVESAYLDGAGEWRILIQIMLPLSLPMLATFSLYYGVERWNEWWLGLLFVKSPQKTPLQLVLRGIIQSQGQILRDESADLAGVRTYPEALKMASVIITMFPVMCLYPFLQKYFVHGLTVGAVKD